MNSNSRLIAWMVWLIASIFYAYQYILRVMPNILLDDIMSQFKMDEWMFGQFSGIYYIGYSLLHLPIGIMLERYGPRKVMSGCILLSVVGMLPLIFADHWIYPIVGRLLLGVGSSAAILGLFKIIRLTFIEERFPRMLSFSVTIGLMGAIYGGAPVSYMREVLNYQSVVQLFSLLGVLLALATYWIIPELKDVELEKSSIRSDLQEILSNPKVIFSCIFAGLMVGPLEGFADVWGTAFLKQVYAFDSTIAASLPSLIFMGMCFGAPLVNLFAEKMGNYLATIVIAGFLMILSFIALLSGLIPSSLIIFSFILVGVSCGYQILAIYKASTYVREQVAGLTTAVANMIIMIFGYAFHSAIGGIIKVMGGTSHPEALIYGVSVIPLALTIGTLGFSLLYFQEKRKKQVTVY